MKSMHIAVLAALLTPGLSRAADVGVSVTIGEPGFYGHIEIGSFPEPELIYPQPVLIQPVAVGVVVAPPVYLHVPPGHEKKWDRYCGTYNACGRPVYFVRDTWYSDVYVPEYRKKHGHGGDKGNHGGGHGHGKGKH